jgi:hypothetical protein
LSSSWGNLAIPFLTESGWTAFVVVGTVALLTLGGDRRGVKLAD